MSQLSRRGFLVGAASMAAGAAIPDRVAKAGSKFDVDRFVDEVKSAHRDDGQAAVEELLKRTVSDPRSVLQGMGEPKGPGIHTMYLDSGLTILNVIWAPLMVLLPHDHNMWATIGIYSGREDNIVWEREGSVIEASGAASLSEKEVFSLQADAIHSVVNPIRRLTSAIHIYGGNFFEAARSEWDTETLKERPFDIEAARRTFQEAAERFKGGSR